MLIILDNVEDPRLLNNPDALFPDSVNEIPTPLTLGCNILLTTRRNFELPAVSRFDMGTLSPGSSYQLLTKDRNPTPSEKQYAKDICTSVGYLPLALVLIAGYLKKYQDLFKII